MMLSATAKNGSRTIVRGGRQIQNRRRSIICRRIVEDDANVVGCCERRLSSTKDLLSSSSSSSLLSSSVVIGERFTQHHSNQSRYHPSSSSSLISNNHHSDNKSYVSNRSDGNTVDITTKSLLWREQVHGSHDAATKVWNDASKFGGKSSSLLSQSFINGIHHPITMNGEMSRHYYSTFTDGVLTTGFHRHRFQSIGGGGGRGAVAQLDCLFDDNNSNQADDSNNYLRRRRCRLPHVSSCQKMSMSTSSSSSNNNSNGGSSSNSTGSKFSTQAKIPTPNSSPTSNSSSSLASMIDPKAIAKTVIETTWYVTKVVVMFLVKLPYNTWFYLAHPQERREKIQEIKDAAKKEFDHYWVGTKVRIKCVSSETHMKEREENGNTMLDRLFDCCSNRLIFHFISCLTNVCFPVCAGTGSF
jgi:hypothetical protein